MQEFDKKIDKPAILFNFCSGLMFIAPTGVEASPSTLLSLRGIPPGVVVAMETAHESEKLFIVW